jgi:hypothetical protein
MGSKRRALKGFALNSDKVQDSERVALRLIMKMVAYEAAIDEKPEQSAAEKRHVEFLRAFRAVGCDSFND